MLGRGRVPSFLEFESEERVFYLRNIKPGDTVFDVGANVGDLTLLFSRFAGNDGHVHAFEPTPVTFGKLGTIIKVAGRTNVVLNQCAVSDKAGVLTFNVYTETHQTWNTLADRPLEKYGVNIPAPEKIEVKSISIDDYCTENKIDRIDLLKIDVEGAELHVLKGARRMFAENRVRICMFEFGQTIHDMGLSGDDIADFFKSMGNYRLKSLMRGRKLFPVNKANGQADFAMNIAYLKTTRLR